MSQTLYKDEKFTVWTFNKVTEALCDEWQPLKPTLQPNTLTAYSYKATRISFEGNVNVTLDITKDRLMSKDHIEIAVLLSLSPDPNSLETHVLNTFSLGEFMHFPQLSGRKIFTIRKDEPWENSTLAFTARLGLQVIQAMLNFESCFHLLLDDEYEINGTKLDMRSMSISHHLNQVKAYRLAEIYGHPEKLDEAIAAIKTFAQQDELTMERLENLRSHVPDEASNWLYTKEFLKKLS